MQREREPRVVERVRRGRARERGGDRPKVKVAVPQRARQQRHRGRRRRVAVTAIAAAEPVLLLAREPLAARLVQDPTEQLGVVVVAPAAEPVVAAVAAVVEREALGFELLRVLRLGLARARRVRRL